MLLQHLLEKTSAYGVFSIQGQQFGLLSKHHWRELLCIADCFAQSVQDRCIHLPSNEQCPLRVTWQRLYQALTPRHPRLQWRNRLCPIYAHGIQQHLGFIDRSLLRYCGIQSFCVRFWAAKLHNQEYLWLTQQRPLHKKIGPGLWDNTVAGLLQNDETPLTALQREIQEELHLNFSNDDLYFYGQTRQAYSVTEGIYHETTLHALSLVPPQQSIPFVPREWMAQAYLPLEKLFQYPLLPRARTSARLLQNYLNQYPL